MYFFLEALLWVTAARNTAADASIFAADLPLRRRRRVTRRSDNDRALRTCRGGGDRVHPLHRLRLRALHLRACVSFFALVQADTT